MSANTPEGKVKKKIDDVLKPYKASGRLWYFKPAASQFGRAGVPDYIGCMLQSSSNGDRYGQFFAIEAKSAKGKVSELQVMQLTAIGEAAGVYFVVANDFDLQQLKDWLHAHS